MPVELLNNWINSVTSGLTISWKLRGLYIWVAVAKSTLFHNLFGCGFASQLLMVSLLFGGSVAAPRIILSIGIITCWLKSCMDLLNVSHLFTFLPRIVFLVFYFTRHFMHENLISMFRWKGRKPFCDEFMWIFRCIMLLQTQQIRIEWRQKLIDIIWLRYALAHLFILTRSAHFCSLSKLKNLHVLKLLNTLIECKIFSII